MNCWKCAKAIPEGKIGFRAVCPHCDTDLHVCKNCRYYSPGKPNDCAVPGTEYIRDREANNFCEEFKVKLDMEKPPKNNFNSLFKE
ncbi:MAG TPA: hypothetical protein VLE89_06715 [Chlamydiales bacterium]|nr:hypothetical protein [Chlamydiales bacterium]